MDIAQNEKGTTKVGLLYGEDKIDINIPTRNIYKILSPRDVPPIHDLQKAIKQSLDKPIGSRPLSYLAKGKKSACILVSCKVRKMPRRIMLMPILECLEKSGIKKKNILLLIATGSHEPTEEKQLIDMLGKEICKKYQIKNHNAFRKKDHQFLGYTSKGTPIFVDKRYLNADLKILTGSIRLHELAGFSGGRKSICPGICDIKTIKHFHGPNILKFFGRSHAGSLDNDTHKDAMEVALKAGADFILNVTLTPDREHVTGIFAGDLVKAHTEGTLFLKQSAQVNISKSADIVIISRGGAPDDSTLYGSIAAVANILTLIKPTATVILVAKCSLGIGNALLEKISNRNDFLNISRDKFSDIEWKTYLFRNKFEENWNARELYSVLEKHEIMLFSELSQEKVNKIGLKHIKSVDEEILLAIEKHGKDAKIIVVPDGPHYYY